MTRISQWLKSRKASNWLILLFLVLIIFPFVVPEYYIHLLVYILIGGLFAQSFNLMFGYMGKLSFGHSAFFGAGAYVVAILCTKTKLPYLLSIPIAVLIGAALGLIVGFFCVPRKMFYFAVLTQGFGLILYAIVFKWYGFTGGDDGIQGIPIPEILESINVHYFYVIFMVTLSMFIIWLILRGPFGYTLRAIRENSVRAEFDGININRIQLINFVIASIFATVAGVLFATFNRSVSPELLNWPKSGDAVMMAVIGGRYAFFGPMVGSAIFNGIQSFILDFTYFWPFVIGLIVIPIILFLPGGLVGFFLQRK
jgi:branched-chain amino acid transport system permease protein